MTTATVRSPLHRYEGLAWLYAADGDSDAAAMQGAHSLAPVSHASYLRQEIDSPVTVFFRLAMSPAFIHLVPLRTACAEIPIDPANESKQETLRR